MPPIVLEKNGGEQGDWCSNSKSPKFMEAVGDADKCKAFYKRVKKAPLVMRLGIKLGAMKKRKRRNH